MCGPSHAVARAGTDRRSGVVWSSETGDGVADHLITHEPLHERVVSDEDCDAGGVEAVHDLGQIRATEALAEGRGAALPTVGAATSARAVSDQGIEIFTRERSIEAGRSEAFVSRYEIRVRFQDRLTDVFIRSHARTASSRHRANVVESRSPSLARAVPLMAARTADYAVQMLPAGDGISRWRRH